MEKAITLGGLDAHKGSIGVSLPTRERFIANDPLTGKK